MDRPERISSGEAMRWNNDVNRRRMAHHERRCTEDPMYRKAYEYLQEQRRRIWEQTQKPLIEAMVAVKEELVSEMGGKTVAVPVSCPCHQMPKSVESQPVNDCMKDSDKPQRIKSHEEVMRERAAMETYQSMSESERIAAGGNALAMGLFAMMMADPVALKRRMDEMNAMQPYLDEIHETDKRYDSEEIKLSCWEW